MSCLIGQDVSNLAVLDSADIELSGCDSMEQIEIVAVKKVETSPTSLAVFDGLGDLVEITDGRCWIVDGGDELQVSAVCGLHQLKQNWQAVDGLLHRRDLYAPCSVSVFHPSMVFKEGNIVGHRLDAKDNALLVVHLDGDLFHVVFDARAFNAGVKIIAHFPIEMAGKFATKKGGDIVGFDRMDGGAHQSFVDGLQVPSALEDDVHCILNLHEAPMVTGWKMADDRAVSSSELIDLAMESFRIDSMGQPLSLVQLIDLHKGVFEHREADPSCPEFGCQFVVTIIVELETEWRPGGHTQIT